MIWNRCWHEGLSTTDCNCVDSAAMWCTWRSIATCVRPSGGEGDCEWWLWGGNTCYAGAGPIIFTIPAMTRPSPPPGNTAAAPGPSQNSTAPTRSCSHRSCLLSAGSRLTTRTVVKLGRLGNRLTECNSWQQFMYNGLTTIVQRSGMTVLEPGETAPGGPNYAVRYAALPREAAPRQVLRQTSQPVQLQRQHPSAELQWSRDAAGAAGQLGQQVLQTSDGVACKWRASSVARSASMATN